MLPTRPSVFRVTGLIAAIAVAFLGLGVSVYGIVHQSYVDQYGGLAIAIIAFGVGLAFVIAGAPQSSSTRTSAFVISSAILACIPVGISAAFAIYLTAVGGSTTLYLAIVGSTAVVTAALYAGMLKSNVTGWQRDALELSFFGVTFLGGLITAVGSITSELT